ncbi:MAG: protein kinase [Bryobacteraceae bacterium]
MPLSSGDRLGPYEIVAPIGKGGMGEVWKARDPRVGRDVAIKISREHFSERFEREAKAIGALNHPNICTLYDVGPNYLVMEYVEGAPLKGPLPLDQALKYAAQICDALDAAHKKGVTHRDLKPDNILLTKAGIKLLDFGLARIGADSAGAEETPTLTHVGEVMGTPAYMSPEQWEGKVADARSDIYAFGCVLYEMLTGKRVSPERMPAQPPAIEDVIKICLAKDPEDRWSSARELRHALQWSANERTPASPSPRRWLWPGLSGAALVLAAVFALLWLMRPAPPTSASIRFNVDAPEGVEFRFLYTGSSISPDGRYIVYDAGHSGENTRALWLRPVDSLDARMIPGTENADTPFWSPDSKSIAFFAENRLKRVDVAGGAPFVLCDLATDSQRGEATGAWSREGFILYGSSQGLMRVPATGGVATPVTHIRESEKESGHLYPQFLPGGKFLYQARGGDPVKRGIYAGSLDQPGNSVLLLNTEYKGLYAPDPGSGRGYLVTLRDGTLFAQQLDVGSLKLEGEAAPLVTGVSYRNLTSWASFWLSDNGLLLYRSGAEFDRARLLWIDRQGNRQPAAKSEDELLSSMSLSPDNQRLAIGRTDSLERGGIWIYDLTRNLKSRFTLDTGRARLPVWSPDARRLVFASDRTGVFQLVARDATGAGNDEQLTDSPYPKTPSDWSSDARYLFYSEDHPKTRNDIWAIPVTPAVGKPIEILSTPFDELYPQLSPDGRWLAYASNESGRFEVYVQAFSLARGSEGSAASDGRWQVSTEGGLSPRWRADGKELFFATSGARQVLSVDVQPTASGFQSGKPREVFSAAMPVNSFYPYDVTRGGERFLVQEISAIQRPSPLTVVVNWQTALKH